MTAPGRPAFIINWVRGTVSCWRRAASFVSPASYASMMARKAAGATFATVET